MDARLSKRLSTSTTICWPRQFAAVRANKELRESRLSFHPNSFHLNKEIRVGSFWGFDIDEIVTSLWTRHIEPIIQSGKLHLGETKASTL
jgi:hypothetical protein